MYSGLILLWIIVIVVFIAIEIANKDSETMVVKAYCLDKRKNIKLENKMHKELYKNKDYQKLIKARKLFRIYLKTKNYKDKKKEAKRIIQIMGWLND